MVVVVDDAHRENEGDLMCLAQYVDAAKINFMITHARGLVCLALAPEIVERLELPPMRDPSKASAAMGTGFTMSIEAKTGVTTGISPADRAHTIQCAIHPHASPQDLVVPGHVFPLKAKPGGVLERPGHTEAAVDLASLVGVVPAGVICEIICEDGSMARMPDLEVFCQKFQLPLITIHDLRAYCRQHLAL
jgi:3,4-dihydroxy 2-butanone 4-phosphate synthase/GTP cyclohydrolase II